MAKQKKKLLFVNESLTLAGGEKSLIALLNNLDPKKYEIDLQLFRYGGALEKFIPKYVHLLPPLDYSKIVFQSLPAHILRLWKKDHLGYLAARLKYSLNLRKGEFNHPEKAQLFWEAYQRVIPIFDKKYDVAIAYAQGVPTFYVLDRIQASKKMAWVNVNVKFPPKNKAFNHKYYKQFDRIIPVSSVTYDHMNTLYPDLKEKLFTIHDILDYRSMQRMATLKTVDFQKNTFNILTVARLNKLQKGYDITLEACKLLKDQKIKFHWYAIGRGPYKEEMEIYIKENELEGYFTFLGTTANPYPYFKAADLYVQTSRHEGFGLTLAEARLLNTPVVTTRFDTVYEQMVHEKNGLVTDIDPKAVADAIVRLIKDKELYKNIVAYLQKEQKENLESVNKFDRLMEESAIED